ncbi:MAG: hypothetical protein KF893_24365 [Caldilineaceae bacterium]|nr:hypothetical protein [Caldilineaceae bacterium]
MLIDTFRRTKKERARNIDLWEQLLALCEVHQVIFSWIKGHAGNQENERCDRLALAALKEANLSIDEGYEDKLEEVEPPKTIQAGDPCRKCSTPVIKVISRKLKTYLFCPSCEATYELGKPPGVENLSLF